MYTSKCGNLKFISILNDLIWVSCLDSGGEINTTPNIFLTSQKLIKFNVTAI